MINIMDGSTGTAHISSKDWATFNEATYGVKNGVFAWGDNFRCEMTTSNKGTIGTGAALVAGRRVWIETPQSFAILNGTQGMKRHDVIGLQYKSYLDDGKTREKAYTQYLKGASSSGSASDPSFPADFLPLFRIPLDGLNVGTPVPIYPSIPSLSAAMTRTVDGDGSLVMQDNGGDGRKATRCRIGGMVWWNSVDEAWSGAVRVPGLPQDFWAVKTKLKVDVPAPAHEVRNAGIWIQTDDNPDGKLWYWGVTPLKAYIGSDGYLYLGHMATRPEWFAALCYVNIVIET